MKVTCIFASSKEKVRAGAHHKPARSSVLYTSCIQSEESANSRKVGHSTSMLTAPPLAEKARTNSGNFEDEQRTFRIASRKGARQADRCKRIWNQQVVGMKGHVSSFPRALLGPNTLRVISRCILWTKGMTQHDGSPQRLDTVPAPSALFPITPYVLPLFPDLLEPPRFALLPSFTPVALHFFHASLLMLC